MSYASPSFSLKSRLLEDYHLRNVNTFLLHFHRLTLDTIKLEILLSWDAPLPRLSPPLSYSMIIANGRRPYDSGLLCFDVLEPKPMIYPGVI